MSESDSVSFLGQHFDLHARRGADVSFEIFVPDTAGGLVDLTGCTATSAIRALGQDDHAFVLVLGAGTITCTLAHTATAAMTAEAWRYVVTLYDSLGTVIPLIYGDLTVSQESV